MQKYEIYKTPFTFHLDNILWLDWEKTLTCTTDRRNTDIMIECLYSVYPTFLTVAHSNFEIGDTNDKRHENG